MARKHKTESPPPKIISGVAFKPHVPDLTAVLWLFLYGNKLQRDPFWRPEVAANWLHPDDKNQPYVGAGRYEHARLFAEIVWPKVFQWSDWTERDIRSFCDYDSTAITGGAATLKSGSAGFYGMMYYACCPFDTGVYIVSTTVQQCLKRIWKMIFVLYPMIRRLFKASVMRMSPTPYIATVLPNGQQDPSHGIFVVPLAKGENVAIETLKGFHPRRSLLIGDEMDSVSPELIKVQDNMRAGTNEFQAIWLGNDPSLFNGLGQIMQPTPGGAVTLAHTEWDSISGVHCIRKDGFDSPNIRDRDRWTGLIRQRDIDEIVRRNGGENTPGVFIMIRGIHPPEGVEDTVLSESLFLRFHCSDGVTWQSSFTSSVLLDPAFGGDRCVIRLMMRGLEAVKRKEGEMPQAGKMKILFGPPVIIPIDATDTLNPPEYQIAHATKAFCEKNGVGPDEMIMDCTGTGRGAAAVLQREWSPRINLCEFGGKCSDYIVSDEDRRPASELYDRKVTELWYSFRQFVEADMVRGLDLATQREFCSRHFTIRGTGTGKKISVETKGEMKERGLASPDLSDNACLGIFLLRQKGVFGTIKTDAKRERHDSLADAQREWDYETQENAYSDELA
jgi:hypothetical protein